jgi:hypothetical protein
MTRKGTDAKQPPRDSFFLAFFRRIRELSGHGIRDEKMAALILWNELLKNLFG